jgi:hypothetical protein
MLEVPVFRDLPISLLMWLYARYHMIGWVGTVDLTVEFEVTDAGSGDPVAGAEVMVPTDAYEE